MNPFKLSAPFASFRRWESGSSDMQLAKEREKERKLEAKKAELAKKKLDAELFKTVQVQKVPFGTGQSVETYHPVKDESLRYQTPRRFFVSTSRRDTVRRAASASFRTTETSRERLKRSICTRILETRRRTRRPVRRGWFCRPPVLFVSRLDLMETWDEEKLRDVVTQNAKGQRTTTDVSDRGVG